MPPLVRPSTADTAGDAVRQVIRAYHGSPYDFDRFDASKIGTGEGAQTFGYGHYLAGNEDVGRYYRDSLSRRVVQTPDGEVPFPEWLSDNMLRENGLDHYRTHWRDTLIPSQAAKGADTSKFTADLRAMDALAAGMPMKSSGRMYEVEIGYPEQALLDLETPLDQQPHILPFAEKAIGKIPDTGLRHDAMGLVEDPEISKGKDVYGILEAYAPPGGGAAFASSALLDAGVPGLRYLDAGSRRAGQGTRNYVMFPGTEDSIRILRKLAVPGVVGVGAASMGGDGDQ